MAKVAAYRSVPALPDLRRSFGDRRAILNSILTVGVVWIVAILASIPLFSVLYMLIARGGARFSLDLFTELPPAGFMPGGGFGNAIVGTLVMVAIASVISVPLGILGGVFLGVLAPDSRLAAVTRFLPRP
jgi:phosphate transport system permease protein